MKDNGSNYQNIVYIVVYVLMVLDAIVSIPCMTLLFIIVPKWIQISFYARAFTLVDLFVIICGKKFNCKIYHAIILVFPIPCDVYYLYRLFYTIISPDVIFYFEDLIFVSLFVLPNLTNCILSYYLLFGKKESSSIPRYISVCSNPILQDFSFSYPGAIAGRIITEQPQQELKENYVSTIKTYSRNNVGVYYTVSPPQ